MKLEQISTHIWSLKTWFLFPMRVWLVKDEVGITLVDAGMPFMARSIHRAIDQLNAGSLQRILLTHGHSDHVGSVHKLHSAYNVPIYAHELEIPYMEGRMIYPRRRKIEQNVRQGIAAALPMTETGELQSIAGLQPFLTPGHSPGHTVYMHEKDGVLLAGDLFTSKRGRLKRPMSAFTANMKEAIASGAIITQLQPKHLEVCHGAPVAHPASQWESYYTESIHDFT
ncbi:MBL fold metallo-hydrolase [Paenibacillus arenosi]|uniref:MBL fold metallo-hydrolase n=1 Tax=Paenibacillus arenosi TaxID=2774142 RepID=A0ABR9AZ66_9BACL|nr:MBL fold metallo-hydrolase [Paenibacillus arenosi]MBD8499426.1 MBL fold metallo-hydrolase [Paenibacillus arenosi]